MRGAEIVRDEAEHAVPACDTLRWGVGLNQGMIARLQMAIEDELIKWQQGQEKRDENCGREEDVGFGGRGGPRGVADSISSAFESWELLNHKYQLGRFFIEINILPCGS